MKYLKHRFLAGAARSDVYYAHDLPASQKSYHFHVAHPNQKATPTQLTFSDRIKGSFATMLSQFQCHADHY